jgi:hypothetical protein
MSGARLVERVYRAATRLYPRRFRDEYGDDMALLIRDQCRDESAWRVAARSTVDLALAIPTRHLEATMHRTSRSLVPIVYAMVAVVGFVMAVIGRIDGATLPIGLAVGIGAGYLAIVAWRREAPLRDTDRTGAWWKFLVAGPCCFALVIVGADVGVEAWFLGIAIVMLGVVSIAIGLVLGATHLWHRRVSSSAA